MKHMKGRKPLDKMTRAELREHIEEENTRYMDLLSEKVDLQCKLDDTVSAMQLQMELVAAQKAKIERLGKAGARLEDTMLAHSIAAHELRQARAEAMPIFGEFHDIETNCQRRTLGGV